MDAVFGFLSQGLLGLDAWSIVILGLITTHITIAGVTLYLHRSMAHRSVTFHPIVAHFFRFWLWLTTGMVTQQWAAIHRRHHAKCETEEDPHSPQVEGLSSILWKGADYYKIAAKEGELIQKYGHGCPDDWIENRLYRRYPVLGVSLLLVLEVILMGFAGLALWAVQMMWIPFFAAGVVNGLGHFWGYRNFKSPDASTNLLPFGILIGGEELHNNHHAHATSPRLSARWFEFDIGWLYIRLLMMVGMAQLRAPLPKFSLSREPRLVDQRTLSAALASRYELMSRVGSAYRSSQRLIQKAHNKGLPIREGADRLAHELHEDFLRLWSQRGQSVEQAVEDLRAWCGRAEASGLQAYAEFSARLRRLQLQTV